VGSLGTQCAATTYSDIYSPIDRCENCPDGFTCSGESDKVACPTNQHSSDGDTCISWNDWLINENKDCETGTYPVLETGKCEPCPAGFSCTGDSFTTTGWSPFFSLFILVNIAFYFSHLFLILKAHLSDSDKKSINLMSTVAS
jgi:hypothetical protein